MDVADDYTNIQGVAKAAKLANGAGAKVNIRPPAGPAAAPSVAPDEPNTALFDFGVLALSIDAAQKKADPAAIASNLAQVLDDAPREEEGSEASTSPCTIKVIGVGGGGGNTLNRMVRVAPDAGTSSINYIACNTDIQALTSSLADSTIQLGIDAARGLGAGGNPSVGQESAVAAADDIAEVVQDADMIFVTAGMGGGTGSGAAPVVAAIARAADCLTIGIVTKPFSFEGKHRTAQALQAIETLQEQVDILIVVSNDKLLEIVPEGLPLEEAFHLADEILRQGIAGISDIVVKPGLINVDFADVRAVMSNAGSALLGIGRGAGKTRARDAAIAAVSSPLIDFPIERAGAVVFTIAGSSSLSLHEVNEVAEVIGDIVADEANIIFGTSVDDTLGDELAVTVVATRFGS